jgi:quercetin dioxygenase-like cupin family protein
MPGHQFVALRSDLDPGASMSPHTHPGSMIGYVFHGSLQVQVAGAKLSTYQRGEWWYVEPAQIIRVTSNTSKAVRASMLAFLLLPKGKPVSTPVGKKA